MFGMILLVFLPFSILACGVLIRERLHPLQMGLLSLFVGLIDETLALVGGNGSLFFVDIFSSNFDLLSLLSLLITVIYWYSAWSVPSYFVYKYMFHQYNQVYQVSSYMAWRKSNLFWLSLLSTVFMFSVLIIARLF
ncbi:MAG: hypothetical protein JEZ06_00615 [Anaerolineaceae bacterium]|nr:hypothetical protein [Anaerolineaceae bacterium]